MSEAGGGRIGLKARLSVSRRWVDFQNLEVSLSVVNQSTTIWYQPVGFAVS